MEMVFRALAIYLILLVVFKVAGRRALSDLIADYQRSHTAGAAGE